MRLYLQADLNEDIRYQRLDEIAMFFKGDSEALHVLIKKDLLIPMDEFLDLALEQLLQKLVRAIVPTKARVSFFWMFVFQYQYE